MAASQHDPSSLARPSVTPVRPGAHRRDVMSRSAVRPLLRRGHFEEHTSFAGNKQAWHSGCGGKCCVHDSCREPKSVQARIRLQGEYVIVEVIRHGVKVNVMLLQIQTHPVGIFVFYSSTNI